MRMVSVFISYSWTCPDCTYLNRTYDEVYGAVQCHVCGGTYGPYVEEVNGGPCED